jgi:osmotically-inducible protein OsmY
MDVDMRSDPIFVDVGRARAGQLAEAVTASLTDSGYAALCGVECQVRDDAVVLEGSVPSYHLKQLAQTFAQRVAGVGRIVNRLAVARPGEVLRTAP